ncbi:hypothetical protein EIP91_005060 [Steccherinum ochraceum]|uniref:Exonuclease domain-containing protein n=1 Tax=Steccherinum ochraceum TaxID=92696 RepID=A0A4R0RZQ4_9APHY|nr:hypothetical protein EIP91_005060 [Steccherinum ochraceum]
MAPSSTHSAGSSTSSSSSGFRSGSSSHSSPFSTTPLPNRKPARAFAPSKFIAVGVQVVHFNPAVRLPMVARVTLVDYKGFVVYDKFVRPTQPVCDYRTAQTGLQPRDLAGAPEFREVRFEVSMLLRDRIIVGHSLWHFLSVMELSHPAIDTRDTALFLPFRKSLKYKSHAVVPLNTLVLKLMNRQIGCNGEIAVEDARAALDLYRSCEQTWEGIVKSGAWPCALPPAAYGNCFT